MSSNIKDKKSNQDNKKMDSSKSLLIDKYKLISNDFLNEDKPILKNEKLIDLLKKISNDEELPHIIFYGNEGCGKKTIVNLFLNMVYGKNIYDLKTINYEIKSSGKKKNYIDLLKSDHHIIIKPNGTNFDRYMIPQILKEYTKNVPFLTTEDKKEFKTVQFDNIDKLAFSSQTSLRRIIEKHSEKYRFVFVCENISKISEPLKSRCLCIHIPYYSNEELLNWSNEICEKYNIKLKNKNLEKIIEISNKNLKKILLGIDLYRYKKLYTTSYDENIKTIINILFSKKLNIRKLRDITYSLTNTVSYLKLFKDITMEILKSIDDEEKKEKIMYAVSDYEISLSKARREIIHIESYYIFIYNLN